MDQKDFVRLVGSVDPRCTVGSTNQSTLVHMIMAWLTDLKTQVGINLSLKLAAAAVILLPVVAVSIKNCDFPIYGVIARKWRSIGGARGKSQPETDTGRLNEVVVGSSILGRLFKMENVYDFKFGMERKEFGMFDDVVVGIQPKKEDQMHYYAFQLKGCEKPKTFGPFALFHELAPPNVSNRPKELLLKDFYHANNNLAKSSNDIQHLTTVKNFLIFTQYKYVNPKYDFQKVIRQDDNLKKQLDIILQRDALTADERLVADAIVQHFSDVKEMEKAVIQAKNFHAAICIRVLDNIAIERDYKALSLMLPTDKDVTFLKLDEEKIYEIIPQWFKDSSSIEDAKTFLSKVLIIASAPRHEKLNESEEKRRLDIWSMMMSKLNVFRHIRAEKGKEKPWITKEALLNSEVKFQEGTVCVRDIVGVVDAATLCQLFIDPTKISVGEKVTGLGNVEGCYIKKNFTLKGIEKEISVEELLSNERIVVLEGMAGLGKSTAMHNAAKNLKSVKGPRVWVVEARFAVLSSVFDKLELTKSKHFTPSNVLRVLIAVATQESADGNEELSKRCFQLAVEGKLENISIGLFLDGLDEVSSEHYNLSLRLIELLNAFKAISHIWISTRNQHRRHTATKSAEKFFFGLKRHTILQFGRRDQKMFFKKFWNVQDDDLDKFNQFTDILLQELEHQYSSYESIIALPLLTMLIAELYEDQYKRNSMEFGKLCESHIIEQFVERQFEKYFKIEAGDAVLSKFKNMLKNDFISKHSLAGLQSIYDRVWFILCTSNDSDQILQFSPLRHILTNSEIEEIQRFLRQVQEPGHFESGLIATSINGEPSFNHRLFAEHFAARYIFETLSRLEAEDRKFKHLSHNAAAMRRLKMKMPPEEIELTEENLNGVRNSDVNDGRPSNQLEEMETFLQDIIMSPISKKVRILFLEMAVKGNPALSAFLQLCLSGEELDEKSLRELHENSEGVLNLQTFHIAFMTGRITPGALRILTTNADLMENDWTCILIYNILEKACEFSDFEVISLVIERGADINIAACGEWTPLEYACEGGRLELAKFLIKKGAKTAHHTDFSQTTPLHLACENGHLEVAMLLLNNGAAVNETDDCEATPMHLACDNGHLEVVRFLIDQGGDVNHCDEYGATPLHWAVENKHRSTIQLLKDNEADIDHIDVRDELGDTQLHKACWAGELEYAQSLLENGANINQVNCEDQNPLNVACARGHHEVARLLIEKGADVNHGGISGFATSKHEGT